MMNVADTNTSHSARPIHELSSVVVPLLKGVLYQGDNPGLWGTLLNLQASVRDYIAVLGLELMLDEAEGYAFCVPGRMKMRTARRSYRAWWPGGSSPILSVCCSLSYGKNWQSLTLVAVILV